MAGVINKPDALNLSGNLNKFILSATSAVSFVLKKGDVVLLEQSYEPGPDGMVHIDVKEVVENCLTYNLNISVGTYEQTGLVGDFIAKIDGVDYPFRVIRAGVANLADTATNWLKLHFLTWQPRVKQITYYSPEWLTYYAVEACTVKLKATYPDKSVKTISLQSCVAGTATTFNLQYSFIAGKLGNSYPSYYEVWAEKPEGAKLSESQFYTFSDVLSEDEQWYLFENSLGGLDTFRAYGTNNLNAEHTHNVADFGDIREEYQIDTERKYTKNTGYLDEYSRRWLLDFFPSRVKYVYEAASIRKIVVTESNATYISSELPSNYTFTWQLAEVSALLNLIKNKTDIPDNLVIPDLASPDFIFPPRLDEYPRLLLNEGVLIPVADPSSNMWHVITVGYLKEYLGGVAPENPENPDAPAVDFLKRSDNGKIYSTLHSCLNEIREDYPEVLTQDVTVSCIKKVTEKRNPQDADKTFDERIYVSVLKEWNKNSIYTLTIDGAGLYTINCNSLGGLRFYQVDNVIVRNVKFSNFANMSEYSTPEEIAAVQFIGLDSNYSRNCYIDSCYFSGVSLDGRLLGSYYSVITKYTDNVYIVNSEFRQNAALTFKLNDTKLVNLIRNKISGRQQSGILGHPGIMSVNGALAVHIEDNDINGDSYNESLFYLNNVKYLYILRNNAYVCKGRFMEVACNSEMVFLKMESNLFRNFLMAPGYMWIKDIIQLNGDISELRICNNTILINGAYYYQMFIRGLGIINTMINCNNLYIVTASVGVTICEIQRLNTLISSTNLYKNDVTVPPKDEPITQFHSMVMINTTNEAGILITPTEGRSVKTLQDKGYETGSYILAKTVSVLQTEGGEPGYGLLSSVAGIYLSDVEYSPAFDIEYKQNGSSSIHLGAYNGNGVVFDETANNFKGYTAINVDEKFRYDSSSLYNSPSDNYHLITHNTLNRNLFVRFTAIGSINNYLALGRYSLLYLRCVVDENGEYVEDQPFKIEIDTI